MIHDDTYINFAKLVTRMIDPFLSAVNTEP